MTETYLAVGETFTLLVAHYGKNDYILRITNSVSPKGIHNENKTCKSKVTRLIDGNVLMLMFSIVF